MTVTDPGFPQGGAWTLQGGGVNTQFCRILPKTAWNWKNLDAKGGGVRPSRPPLDPPLNDYIFYDIQLPINQVINKTPSGCLNN